MDKTTYINVGKSGTFKSSGNHNYDTLPSDVDAIIDLLNTNNQRKIGLYFHGGLVKDSNGVESAKIMNSQIIESNLHPISFVWETGIFEVIRDSLDEVSRKNLFKIAQRIIFRRLKKRLSSAGQEESIIYKDYSYASFIIEPSLLEKLSEDYGDLSEDEVLGNIQEEIEIDINKNPELVEGLDYSELNDILFDEKFRARKSLDDEKALLGGFFWSMAKITYKVIKRYVRKTDHYFQATLTEEIYRRYYVAEIGAYIWKEMKDKAEEMWKSNNGRSGENLLAGTYLLTKLNELGTKEEPIIIDAIGHSAGAIAICYLIKAAEENYPNIKVNNLVFLAPACRSELFNKEVVQKTERFNEIRVFTMSDGYEVNDTLVNGFNFIYPHSLLYFISGILEDEGKSDDAHILGLERHINWRNYMKHSHLKSINRYLNESGKNRLVLSKTTLNNSGLSSHAIDHGQFDNDPTTLASIKHILINGLT